MEKILITQENGTSIENPSDADISNALQDLSIGNKNSYLVATINDTDNYLKISGDLYNGFKLEYKDKNSEEIKKSLDDNISFDIAFRILQNFIKKGNNWKELVAWSDKQNKRMMSVSFSQMKPEIMIVILLLIILVVFVFFAGTNNPFSARG